MNVAELFIRRPVMTTLVMVGLLAFGIMGYRLLPVSDLPNIDRPTISVSASLPGANPETMASSVATPLEREFSTIAGTDSVPALIAAGAMATLAGPRGKRDLPVEDVMLGPRKLALQKGSPRRFRRPRCSRG